MHKGYDLYNAAVPIGLIAFFLRSLLYKIFTSAPPASETVGLADSFVPVSVGFCLVVFALAIIWGLALAGRRNTAGSCAIPATTSTTARNTAPARRS